MAVDEQLADRIRTTLKSKGVAAGEKRMFGGIAFMIRGHMAVGIMNTGALMARVGPEQNGAALKEPGATQMAFRTPMIGYVTVDPGGIAGDAELEAWIDRCLAFNTTLPAK
ncbi:TfoX/Sxy family protein [Candidatus Berkelbacteria bacterium]|nr:TfoX/Sxy family protein [Candidatus Berkelbacteria bacterium]